MDELQKKIETFLGSTEFHHVAIGSNGDVLAVATLEEDLGVFWGIDISNGEQISGEIGDPFPSLPKNADKFFRLRDGEFYVISVMKMENGKIIYGVEKCS